LQEAHQKLEERLYYFTPLSVHQDLERRSVKAIQILEHRLHNYAPLEAYQSLEERLQGYVSRASEVDGSSQTNIKDLEDSLLKFHDACDISQGKSVAVSDHVNMHRESGWMSHVQPSETVLGFSTPSINTLEEWKVAFDKIAKVVHYEDEEHHMLIEKLAARFEEEATGHHESFDSQRSSTNRLAFDVAELKDAYRELEDSLARRSFNDGVNRGMPQEERCRIESLLELERGARTSDFQVLEVKLGAEVTNINCALRRLENSVAVNPAGSEDRHRELQADIDAKHQETHRLVREHRSLWESRLNTLEPWVDSNTLTLRSLKSELANGLNGLRAQIRDTENLNERNRLAIFSELRKRQVDALQEEGAQRAGDRNTTMR